VPAFYEGRDPYLRAQFLRACESAGAEPFFFEDIAMPGDIRLSLEGTEFSYRDEPYRTPLIGLHQAQNTANVISVFKVLRERGPLFANFGDDVIRRGVAETRWPGRVEVLPRQDGRVVILDGAHNEHGLRALLATLGVLTENGSMDPVGAVVFGIMRDKTLPPLLDLLQSLSAPVYCTQAPIKRALPAVELEAAVLAKGIRSEGAFINPTEALRAAADETRGTIICCGSLFLVGSVKKELGLYD